MEEALVALGMGGGLQCGQQGVILHGDQQGVLHPVLGGAGVDAEAVDRYHGFGGVEGFVLIVCDVAAVQGIGKVGAEALHIKIAGAETDLLVRGEAQLDGAVGGVFGQQLLHRLQNDGDARLVVGAQQGGAIGADQVLAHELLQLREIAALHDNVLLRVQHQVTALIVEDLGLDVLTGHIRCGVHVGDEADGGQMLTAGGGGYGGVNIAGIVHEGIVDAQSVKLLYQQPRHVELAVGAGSSTPVGMVVTFTPHLGIAHQTRNNVIHSCDSPYSSSDSRFSGFRHFRSSRTNRPSLRISTSSNQISPPPYSGVWIWIRSQWTADLLPLEALS